MTKSYIALGSNLGEREAYLAKALQALRDHPAISVLSVSSFLETEDWSYVVPSPDEAPQLFVAPDDAWQANNIASRCHEQLEEFAHLRQAIDTAAQQGRSWRLLELDPMPEPSTADD